MNTTFTFPQTKDRLVYVKPVAVSDLPQEVQDAAGELEKLYAVHNAEGAQLALVANRQLAFHLAREHQMTPVTVH